MWYQHVHLSPNSTAIVSSPWTSCQIRKIAGCACTGNAENDSPRRLFQRKPLVSDPGMHRAVMHVGIAYPRWRGKRSRHSRLMSTRNFTYFVKCPWQSFTLINVCTLFAYEIPYLLIWSGELQSVRCEILYLHSGILLVLRWVHTLSKIWKSFCGAQRLSIHKMKCVMQRKYHIVLFFA